eukprot:9513736-Lingulodinium_polyedra.AAC.1
MSHATPRRWRSWRALVWPAKIAGSGITRVSSLQNPEARLEFPATAGAPWYATRSQTAISKYQSSVSIV